MQLEWLRPRDKAKMTCCFGWPVVVDEALVPLHLTTFE